MRYRWLSSVALPILLLGHSAAHATINDKAFTESAFVSGLGPVTGLAWAPDGSNRLFYLLKDGTIGIVQDGARRPEPFAVVSPIFTASECGLLGIAFDPGFATNHFVYVFATVSANEQQILRYTDRNGVGVTPQVVVAGLPTLGKNHDGGAIGIGPDGTLYWAIGDNGNGTGVGDDLSSLAAKVGRANLDGTAPTDNPFADGDGPNNDFIWARGFRNPFTFAWQPSNEQLWVTVTGGAFEQIFTPHAGDNAGWNKWESNQPAGFLLPAVSYRTNDVMAVAVITDGATRKNGVVTIKTLPRHRFVPGAKITISGVADASFNGDHYVVDIPTISSFTFAQAGADATSGGGVASTQNLGGAVTGGSFWDSSGVPEDYRGNFFFGDYNSGQIVRVRVGAQSKVTNVDQWATGNEESVDVEPGPDGALYYVGISGNILRATYVATRQGLVVSNLHLRTREGAATALSVRLSQAPASPVQVMLARATGDEDLAVIGPGVLTFGVNDWAVPQSVLVRAREDLDTIEDEAWFDVSSEGLTTERVRVRAIDSGANVPTEDPTTSGGAAGTGAGGEAGVTGDSHSQVGGAAGATPNPDDTGGASSGPVNAGAAGENTANGGAPGSAAGESPGAEGGAEATDRSSSSSDSACGCRVAAGDSGVELLAMGTLLVARVLRRRRPA